MHLGLHFSIHYIALRFVLLNASNCTKVWTSPCIKLHVCLAISIHQFVLRFKLLNASKCTNVCLLNASKCNKMITLYNTSKCTWICTSQNIKLHLDLNFSMHQNALKIKLINASDTLRFAFSVHQQTLKFGLLYASKYT